MKGALLVIDMQNDYLWDKRKPKFSYDTERLVEAVNDAIASYRKLGYDIIYIAQMFPNIITNKWFIGFSIKGTPGADLYSGMDIASDLYFEKNLSDAYSSRKFREFMERASYGEVVLCGLDECGCVGATAAGASKRGVKVKMLTDSIGRRFPDKKVSRTRAKMKALGVEYI